MHYIHLKGQTFNKKIEISYAIDNKMFLFLVVAITSLMEHSTNIRLFYNVYVMICDGINKTHDEGLKNLSRKYNRLTISIIHTYKELPKVKPFKNSCASCLRLFTPEIFPNISKMIYLDVDTLILRDLDTFYNLNMTGLFLRGLIDYDYPHDLDKVNITVDDYYINSGVLLMNLDEMRRDNFTGKVIDFAEKYYDKNLAFIDQAIIHGCCHNKTGLLPIDIGFQNVFTHSRYYKVFFRAPYYYKYYTHQQVKKIIYNLTIVHLIDKPWNNRHPPYRKIWGKMVLKTDYADQMTKTYTWINFLCK